MSTPSSNSIQDIINAESIRLNEKEQSFNNLQFGKQRVLELNKNFQERTTAFNWIFTVFFSTLAFMILLFYLNTVIYGIDIFVNVAAFAVGVLGLGYSIFLYISFRQRDPSDFDKIMYQPPGTISADQAASNASANYSSDDVLFRPDSDGSTDGTGNTTTTGNVMIGGDGTGSGMYGNVMIGGNVRGDGTYGNVRGDGTYGNVRGDGIGSNMPMNGPYGDLSSNVYNNYYNNTNYDYDYQYNNTYNTYGSGSGDGSGIFNKTPIPTDPDKQLGTVTTTSTPSASVNFNIPKLITNEIYLGDTGRDTILVLDQKTFVLFNLHKAKYLFKSLDNVFFTNPTNSKFTATVVTEGPDSKFGVKIFGKGIMITINSTDTYYFYPSNIPATLRENDVFLGSTGQKIEVISKNKFNLLNLTTDPNINSNSKNIQSIYNSIDGYYFIDSENNSNVAKLVIQGPDANTADFNKIIYGQAILLSNDNTGQKTYYYYNGNTGPKSDDYDDIPDNVFSDTPALPTPTTTAAPTTAAPTTLPPMVFDSTLVDSKTTCKFEVKPFDSNTTLIIITSSGSLFFKYKVNTCNFALIGGGGGGGNHANDNAGGGGGGGGLGMGDMNGTLLNQVDVSIGLGGGSEANGGDTSIRFKDVIGNEYGNVTSYGGGSGGHGKWKANSGGSGGGGGSGSTSNPEGGSGRATSYNGGLFSNNYTKAFSGARGQRSSGDGGAGGGGAGCNGAGSETYPSGTGGRGGAGLLFYGIQLGGGGGGGAGGGSGGEGGNGGGKGAPYHGNGSNGSIYGAGGGGAGNGSGLGGIGFNGVVILRIENKNFIR